MSDARAFLEQMFPDTNGGHILVWTVGKGGDEKTSLFFPTATAAADAVEKMDKSNKNVYFGVGTRKDAYPIHRRGAKKDIHSIHSLWVDIDIASDAHATKALPEDMEEALGILDALALPPSFLISTGHGLQAFWTLSEPLLVSDIGEIETYTRAFVGTFQAFAKQSKWEVDAVHDITRVMRLPGTSNVKLNDGAIVEIITKTDVKYTIEEIFDHIDLEEGFAVQEPEQHPERGVDGVIIMAGAVPPFAKFQALVENHSEFGRRWRHERPPAGGDTSLSAYDFSLASIAAHNGWTAQEICNLIISHREKQGSDKGARKDYVVQTIKRAMNGATSAAEIDLDLMDVAEKIASGARSSDMDIPTAKEDILQKVSSALGVRITSVVRFNADEPTFKIVANGVRIDMGTVENITSWPRFQNKIAAHIGKGIPAFKGSKWVGIWELILATATTEEIADGGFVEIQYKQKLQKYLESCTLIEVFPEMKLEERSEIFHSDNFKMGGELYFTLDDFMRWLKFKESDNVPRNTLAKTLKAFGCAAKVINTKDVDSKIHTTRYRWFIPEQLLYRS